MAEIEIPGLTLHGDHIDYQGKQIPLNEVDKVELVKQRNPLFLILSLIGVVGGCAAAVQWSNGLSASIYDQSTAVYLDITVIIYAVALICFLLWRVVGRRVLVVRTNRQIAARVPASKDDAERFIRAYERVRRTS